MIVEITRDVLGVEHADHAESNPDAETLVITPLECSLVGQRHAVHLEPDSRVAGIYGARSTVEPFFCNYGLNPAFEPDLQAAGLYISGRDPEGAARVVELEGHPFFLATLYVFQARDPAPGPHPITRAFLAACSSQRSAG